MGSNPLTSPAKRVENLLASKRVMGADAGTPCQQRLPGFLGANADGRDQTHAGDGNPAQQRRGKRPTASPVP